MAQLMKQSPPSSAHSKFGYEIVGIKDWLIGWKVKNDSHEGENGFCNEERETLPLVDLRSYEEFQERHLHLSSVNILRCGTKELESTETKDSIESHHFMKIVPIVNLPLSTLLDGERSCELPPRHVQFAILVPKMVVRSTDDEGNLITCSLDDDSPIHQLFFASKSKATSQSRKPWLVRQVLIDDPAGALWKEADDLGIVKYGRGFGDKEDKEISDEKNFDRVDLLPFHKSPRLWKPDPLVSSEILPILKHWLTSGDCNNAEQNANNFCNEKNIVTINSGPSTNDTSCQIKKRKADDISDRPDEKVGAVLDLGSGAGRDICFLAEELKEFYHLSISGKHIINHQVEHGADDGMQSKRLLMKRSLPMRFIGVDNHKGSSKRCLPLWKNRGVDDATEACLLDLNKLDLVRNFLMETSNPAQDDTSHIDRHMQPQQSNEQMQLPTANPSSIVCIYAIRFLNRKLFAYIAHSITSPETPTTKTSPIHEQQTISSQQPKPLPPPLILPLGTIFAVSHFCKPEEGASWDFDHPKESNVFERWELKTLFEGITTDPNKNGDNSCNVNSWLILKDEICSDGDHGRTLIQFVAKKIA